MKYVLICLALVAGTIALNTPLKKRASVGDVFQELQKIVNKFTNIAVHSKDAGSEKNLVDLVNRLESVLDVINDVFPDEEVDKRDNLIDKTAAIQDILDKYVASIVNGTPIPPELVALGAEGDDPETFITKVIILAAGNLGRKRDLMSVARVI